MQNFDTFDLIILHKEESFLSFLISFQTFGAMLLHLECLSTTSIEIYS